MSDGYSDMIEYFHNIFEECLKFMVRFHMAAESGMLEQEITERECEDFHHKICSIPQAFWSDELKLPKYLQERFDKWSSAPRMPYLEELFFLLIYTNHLSQVICLQKATKYRDRLLLFFDENGYFLKNGAHFQNRFWHFMEGDQDIMLGYAKKRCHRQPFTGKPVMLVADRHRYRRHCFVLKEVLDIAGRSLVPQRNN